MSDEQAIETRAREILNRYLEYANGLERGQVMMKTSNALAAVKEAIATPPVTGEVGELVEELAYAVWMVGNIDNDEDKARWWDDFQGLWERAATIVAKAHGRGVNCTEGFDAFRATLSNTEQPS